MASKNLPPALRIVTVAPGCDKVFCQDCEHFIGFIHANGDGPIVEDCHDDRKKCAAKDTLEEYRSKIDKQIAEDEAQRLEREAADEIYDNPFEFGDDE